MNRWWLPVKRRHGLVDKVLVYKAKRHNRSKYGNKRWRVSFWTGIVGAFTTFEEARVCAIAEIARIQTERKHWRNLLRVNTT